MAISSREIVFHGFITSFSYFHSYFVTAFDRILIVSAIDEKPVELYIFRIFLY